MTVALPNDKISKQGKFTVSEVFHWKESKEMLQLIFQQPVCGYRAWDGHCYGTCVFQVACFRKNGQLCEQQTSSLRHWADMLSGHRWVFTGKPRRSASHTPWCWGWFCQLAVMVAHWQWQFSPSRAIWEFSYCSVSNKQTKTNHKDKRHGKIAMGSVIRTLLLSPKSKTFLTFNDSPRCFPAQDSFAIHLVLLITAHYCEGHAFLLGKDMWRHLSNLFRAAPSLFLSHLSSLHLIKCKAFCKGGGSPQQNSTHHCYP